MVMEPMNNTELNKLLRRHSYLIGYVVIAVTIVLVLSIIEMR